MKKCPQCQKEFSNDTKFCPDCGVELTEIAEAAAPAETQAAPAEAQAAPAEAPAKKSKLPLILALCGVLVLGVVVGIIAANAAGGKKEEAKQETTEKKSGSDDKKKAAKDLKDKVSKKDDQKGDKKSEGDNFYQADWCSFSYPQEWVGKVKIEENTYEKIRAISIYMNEKSEYGNYPLLYAIELSDYPFVEDPPASGNEFYYNPGYRETLGVSTTGVYAHLVQPTDMQCDPSQQDAYMKLFNADLGVIRSSFKFDY